LQSGGSSASSSSSASGESSPGDIKSKIDGLIANEVSSGKLTQQQATELQGLFQNTFGGDSQAGGGSSGTGGFSMSVSSLESANLPTILSVGPSLGTFAGSASSSSGSSGSTSTDGTNTSPSSSAAQILQQFLQSLQNSNSSTSTYNASGSATSISDSNPSLSSFLVNYQS
jgi:hypothetical protein